jgi:hypothetical protein
MAKSPDVQGLQPIDLHQRVLRLLVYLDQHGFRVSYELWANPSAVVWCVRPIDQSNAQLQLPLHESCQEELYFPWAREIVQLG